MIQRDQQTAAPFEAPAETGQISDVPGVRVGHTTVVDGDVRTGVTTVVPDPVPSPARPLRCGLFVGNGHGKLVGATELIELGELQTPLVLTNTLSTFLAADAQNPASVQKMNVDAPVTVAALAPAGQPATLLPPEQRTALPRPGAEVAPSTPAVAESRLSNGMRVLVAPTQGLPLVSARLGFDAGSSDDPAGKAGVASLTAALLTQGTATRTAPQIATEIEQLGASVGAGAGVDFTNVYANAPADVFPQAMTLMADLVRNPAFANEELERQQAQTLDALRVALSQPGAIASQVAGRVVFGDAPYGAPGSGTVETVPTVTPSGRLPASSVTNPSADSGGTSRPSVIACSTTGKPWSATALQAATTWAMCPCTPPSDTTPIRCAVPWLARSLRTNSRVAAFS